MVIINNVAGDVVATAESRIDAARWWLESGRMGDWYAETGELMSTLATNLGFRYQFDQSGCVAFDDAP